MKKKKLKLKDLEVKSFLTSLDSSEALTLKGEIVDARNHSTYNDERNQCLATGLLMECSRRFCDGNSEHVCWISMYNCLVNTIEHNGHLYAC